MSRCSTCSQEVSSSLEFRCSYCGRPHCSDHRLPENHGCERLETANSLGPDFRGLSDSAAGYTPPTVPEFADAAEDADEPIGWFLTILLLPFIAVYFAFLLAKWLLLTKYGWVVSGVLLFGYFVVIAS